MASTSRLDRASPRPVPSTAVVLGAEPLEGHEQPLEWSAAMPGPGVGRRDAHAAVAVGARSATRDRAALAVVLDRVGEQVEQDLLEALAVGEHVRVARRRRLTQT